MVLRVRHCQSTHIQIRPPSGNFIESPAAQGVFIVELRVIMIIRPLLDVTGPARNEAWVGAHPHPGVDGVGAGVVALCGGNGHEVCAQVRHRGGAGRTRPIAENGARVYLHGGLELQRRQHCGPLYCPVIALPCSSTTNAHRLELKEGYRGP